MYVNDREHVSPGSRTRGEAGALIGGRVFTRAHAHLDLPAGPHWRFFGELVNGLAHDEAEPPPGPNEDQLDVLNLFADFSVSYGNEGYFTLRAGRQQLSFGRERLVSTRDGTKVPRTFDAVRGIVKRGRWQIVPGKMEPDPKARLR